MKTFKHVYNKAEESRRRWPQTLSPSLSLCLLLIVFFSIPLQLHIIYDQKTQFSLILFWSQYVCTYAVLCTMEYSYFSLWIPVRQTPFILCVCMLNAKQFNKKIVWRERNRNRKQQNNNNESVKIFLFLFPLCRFVRRRPYRNYYVNR